MRKWAHLGTAADVQCPDAPALIGYPQWYGSRDDMLAFGRECVTNTNWGGNMPLILADAHREYWMYLDEGEAESNYWTQPEVWPDMKSAFGRFFTLNPEAASYDYNYAWHVFACGQWTCSCH